MKIFKIIFSVVLLSVFLFCGCATDVPENNADMLTMYIIKDTPIASVIKQYNNNKNNKTGIKLIEFENNNELNTKLNAEMMAGNGPDLIFYDLSYNGVSNIEKMISQEMFADFNDLISNDESESKINFEDFNKPVMDSGVYNGKRYFMPISYMPDIMITTNELCAEYSVDVSEPLTYKKAGDMLSEFLNKNKQSQNTSVFYWINNEFYSLINSNIDIIEKTNTLDSTSFLSDLNVLDNMNLQNKSTESSEYSDPLDYIVQGKVMFVSLNQVTGSEPNGIGHIYYYIKSENQKPVLISSLSNKGNNYSAFFDKGLLINKNSAKKDEAYKFVKYMLSEKVQENTEIGLPVNKKAQSKLIDAMSKLSAKDLGIQIENNTETQISADYIKSYTDFLNNISFCKFRNDYFNSSVIGDIVSEYVSGNITKEQFVNQVQSKTKIYLEE